MKKTMTTEHALAMLQTPAAQEGITLGLHPYTIMIEVSASQKVTLIIKQFYDIIESHAGIPVREAAEIISMKFNIQI